MTLTPKLASLRQDIDEIDYQLMVLLANRFSLTRQVGVEKVEAKLSSLDQSREADVVKKWRQFAVENQLDGEFMEKIIRSIMQRVVEEHQSLKVNCLYTMLAKDIGYA